MFTDPSDLLKIYLCEHVIVKIRSGELLGGVLKAFDEHLNVLISVDGESVFLRGENILFLGQRQ